MELQGLNGLSLPLTVRAEGLHVICIDALHAKAALDIATNKTDANDADGLANLAEVEFFREVHVKGFGSMLARTLVEAWTQLVHMTTELSNQIIDESRASHQVASYRALAGTHFSTTDLQMGFWGDQQKQLTGRSRSSRGNSRLILLLKNTQVVIRGGDVVEI